MFLFVFEHEKLHPTGTITPLFSRPETNFVGDSGDLTRGDGSVMYESKLMHSGLGPLQMTFRTPPTALSPKSLLKNVSF